MDTPMLRYNVYFMRLVGMYELRDDWSFLRKVGYYVMKLLWFSALVGGVIANILRIVLMEKIEKMSDIAMNILYIELFGSICLRAIYFAYEHKGIDHLSRRMETEFRQSTKLSFKPKSMDLVRKYNNYFYKFWMSFVLIVGAIMPSSTLFKSPMEVPFEVWTWYNMQTPSNFTITFFIEFLAIELMLISYANLDMLHATFMILTSAQVDILATEFNYIIQDALKQNGCDEEEIIEYFSYENDESFNQEGNKRFEKIEATLETESCKRRMSDNLKYCIVFHQDILSYIDEYQVFISPYLLILVNFNFSYMIFMLFTIVTTESTSMYFSLALYTCGCVMQIFLTCFLGDLISSRVENMRDVFYAIPWYVCDRYFLSSFRIIQIRMLKPVSITAGKLLALNLDTFLEFMKKAFSFFSVLRQMN